MKPNGTRQLFVVCIFGALSFVGCETNKPTTNDAANQPQALPAPQVPIPTTAAEVPGPASGTAMSTAYVQTIGRVAYLWGWALVNNANRAMAFSKAPEPGLLGGVLPIAFLSSEGTPCKADTRGLLGRTHIIAGRHRRIGKETDRRWEEGDDLESLMYVPVEYEHPAEQKEPAHHSRARERLIRKIKRIGIRKLVRYGCRRRILEKICRKELLPTASLKEYELRVEEYISKTAPA